MKLKSTFIQLLILFIGISSMQAQVYFSDNFNDNDLSNWTLHDLDGDDSNWETINFEQVIPSFGSGTLISYSESVDEVNRDPDNLMVSPLIDLTDVSPEGLILFFEGIGDYDVTDHYAVYLTESNDPEDIIASTPLIEEDTTYEFTKEIDLSGYAGGQWYLSFRHFDSPSGYYVGIDNLSIKIPQENYASLEGFFIDTGSFVLPNTSTSVELTVKNNGTNAINSLQIDWNDGTDHTENIDVEIPPGISAYVAFPQPFVYSDVSQHIIQATITGVNGSDNVNTNDNSTTFSITTISQSADKKILIEESTGTWCGYCPRGIVLMEYLEETYDDQAIGVAVHLFSSDPMNLPEYERGAAFAGAPFMNVDRDLKSISFTQEFLDAVIESNELISPADLDVTGELEGMNITIDLDAQFYSNFSAADFRFAVIMAENNVTGTSEEGYDQTNYYSGQGTEMGGYENLPNPVPAEQMVYNHVSRALIGGYDGQEDSVPAVMTDGQSASYSFNYELPEGSDPNDFYAVGIIIDNETGIVINSERLGLSSLGVNDVATQDKGFNFYPNPASESVQINVKEAGAYTLSVYDLAGRLITKQEVTAQNSSFSYDVNRLPKGAYIVTLSTKSESYSKKLIVK